MSWKMYALVSLKCNELIDGFEQYCTLILGYVQTVI